MVRKVTSGRSGGSSRSRGIVDGAWFLVRRTEVKTGDQDRQQCNHQKPQRQPPCMLHGGISVASSLNPPTAADPAKLVRIFSTGFTSGSMG